MRSSEVLFLGLAVMVTWGVWSSAGKIASSRIGMQALFWYTLTTVATIIGYLAAAGQLWPLKPDTRGIIFGLLAGLTGAGGALIFYYLLKKYPGSIIIPLTSVYPAFSVLIMVFFLKERLTHLQGVGIILAIAGVILLGI